jgi:hypothetical protein
MKSTKLFKSQETGYSTVKPKSLHNASSVTRECIVGLAQILDFFGNKKSYFSIFWPAPEFPAVNVDVRRRRAARQAEDSILTDDVTANGDVHPGHDVTDHAVTSGSVAAHSGTGVGHFRFRSRLILSNVYIFSPK